MVNHRSMHVCGVLAGGACTIRTGDNRLTAVRYRKRTVHRSTLKCFCQSWLRDTHDEIKT